MFPPCLTYYLLFDIVPFLDLIVVVTPCFDLEILINIGCIKRYI